MVWRSTEWKWLDSSVASAKYDKNGDGSSDGKKKLDWFKINSSVKIGNDKLDTGEKAEDIKDYSQVSDWCNFVDDRFWWGKQEVMLKILNLRWL